MMLNLHAACTLLRCIPVSAALMISVLHGHVIATERFEGFTEPHQDIELAVSEAGVLSQVHVKEGSLVQKGQVVAQLDTSVLERTLEIARQRSESVGALNAAQAELELRLKHFKQLTKLRQRGHATQHEMDRASTEVRVAESRLAMAQEEVALQRLECRRIEAQIQRRVIRSPINGVVSEVWRDVGESFSAGDTRVVTIVQLDRLRAKFSLEPSVALSFKPLQQVRLSIGAEQSEVAGIVESVSPVMDATSATIEVTVEIENSDRSVPSGARCWLKLWDGLSSSERTLYTSDGGPSE